MSKKRPPKSRAAKRAHGPRSQPAPSRSLSKAPLRDQTHFSLQDEAHNTGRQSHWTIDTRLRDRAVTFVSAGVYSTMDEQAASCSQPLTPDLSLTRQSDDNPAQLEHVDRTVEPAFFVDVTGDASLAKPAPGIPVRTSSVHSNTSASSEEIMFRGRASRPTVIEDPVHHAGEASAGTGTVCAWNTGVEWVHRSKPGVGWSLPKVHPRTSIKPPVLTFRPKHRDPEGYDSATEDYIENIRKHDPQLLDTAHFATRAIDSQLSSAQPVFSRAFESGTEVDDGPRTRVKETVRGVSRGDEVSDISGSTGELRSSEHDHTRTGEDGEDDEDDESVGSAEGEVEWDEEEDTDSESSGDLGSMTGNTGVLDDETLALLYDMQERMGIRDDSLVLFDASMDAHVMQEAKGYSKQKPQKARRNAGSFPNATLLADILDEDPYAGFEVMALERPSLRKKNKGKATQLLPEFELSDTEMADSLRLQWKTDRDKKRARKQERAELRGQGLLGKKKARTSDTYSEGMTVWQIGQEMERFLGSGRSELAFPAMDKRQRKMIHELANAFNVKTKSVGNGNNRYTKMIRTKNTAAFDQIRFNAKATRFERRFLPRMDAAGGKSTGSFRGGFGQNAGGVRYADGEVVGATAPELGADNRGRAMLEKLGWVSGTALGAASNKGILEPITHVVKNSKAGLG